MSLFGDVGNDVTGDMSLQSEPIPAKTQVQAVIDEAKFDTYDGEDFISIVWTVLKPSNYANRKVFQKLRVYDEDAAKRKRQQQMLAAIDFNASGGELMKLSNPTGDDLMRHLFGKQMVLRLQVWEMSGNSGNWVSQVSPKGDGVPEVQEKADATPGADGDIPF